MRAAVFDEANDLWRVELDSGEVLTARFLINGSGILTTPNLPDIDGVESFAGASHPHRRAGTTART